MKKRIEPASVLCKAAVFVVVAALLLAQAAAAQTQKTSSVEAQKMDSANIGMKFPNVTADSLAGTKESIPESCRGKVKLVAVAFLRESQSQLDSWLNPFYEKFGKRDGFMFYEIPMISSGYKFMKFVIDGGMRGGIPSFKHKHVVTMYGDVEKYLTALHLDPRYGYAFLLDREGIIAFQAQGSATGQSLQELFSKAEALAK
jgi:hypothetical protein